MTENANLSVEFFMVEKPVTQIKLVDGWRPNPLFDNQAFFQALFYNR